MWETPSAHGPPNRYHSIMAADVSSKEKIYGPSYGGFFGDEFNTVLDKSFYDVLLSRIRVNGHNGATPRSVMTCNPKSPHHWSKLEWVDKCEKFGWAHLTMTFKDNPGLKEDYYKLMYHKYKGTPLEGRLLRGEWTASSGLVYPGYDSALLKYQTRFRPVSFALGIDVASATTTHALLVARMKSGVHWVINEFVHDSRNEGQLSSKEQIKKMFRKFMGYPITEAFIDPAADWFQTDMEKMRRRGEIPPTIRIRHGKAKPVDKGIETVSSWINSGKLKIDRKCESLVKELGSYSWDEKAAEAGEDKPMKKDDHGVDALRYYCYTKSLDRPAMTIGRY